MRFPSPILTVVLVPLLVVSPLPAQLPVMPAGNISVETPLQDLQIRLIESEAFAAQTNTRAERGFAVAVTTVSGQPVADVAVVFRMPDSGATGSFNDGTHAAVAYTDNAGVARFRGIQWGGTSGMVAVRITASKGSAHAGMLLEHTLNQVTASNPSVPAGNRSATSLKPPTIEIPEQASETSAYVPAEPSAPPLAPGVLSKKSASASEISIAQINSNTASNPAARAPVVSVTSASPDTKIRSGSKTKWIVLAAVVAGAGIGVAMMVGKGKGSTTSTPASTISIGAPTVSVGNP